MLGANRIPRRAARCCIRCAEVQLGGTLPHAIIGRSVSRSAIIGGRHALFREIRVGRYGCGDEEQFVGGAKSLSGHALTESVWVAVIANGGFVVFGNGDRRAVGRPGDVAVMRRGNVRVASVGGRHKHTGARRERHAITRRRPRKSLGGPISVDGGLASVLHAAHDHAAHILARHDIRHTLTIGRKARRGLRVLTIIESAFVAIGGANPDAGRCATPPHKCNAAIGRGRGRAFVGSGGGHTFGFSGAAVGRDAQSPEIPVARAIRRKDDRRSVAREGGVTVPGAARGETRPRT